ncbi:MAG TPA: serine/threonine-protein kinase [Kofleriaceae bacterium]
MQTEVVQEFGSYFVYEQLGVGGMATVHRAETRGPDGRRKSIALKRLLPQAAAHPDTVRSFVDEGRLASSLHHANVAEAYDLGRVDDTYFIAMELVPGPTLAQIIRRCNEIGRPLPVAIAVRILIQICDALDYTHNLRDEFGRPLNLVHRDVSPANVIVSNSGIVKLIDFGIAKPMLSSRTVTKAGSIKGKVGYIAPEYQRGKLDARADLFAVGVIAHELLTARKLFQVKDELESLRRVRELAVDPPSRLNPLVPADLDDIVMLGLSRNPAERWQTASALRFALTNVARSCGPLPSTTDVADWLDRLFTYVVAPLECGDSMAVEIIREPEPQLEPDPAAPLPAAMIATEIVRVPAPPARNRFALAMCILLVLAGAGAVAAQLSGLV